MEFMNFYNPLIGFTKCEVKLARSYTLILIWLFYVNSYYRKPLLLMNNVKCFENKSVQMKLMYQYIISRELLK